MTLQTVQASMSEVDKTSRSVLPPWLWFWLVFYAIGLPVLWNDRLGSTLHDLFFGLPFRNLAEETSPLGYLDRLGAVLEILPHLLLILGIVTIFFPHLRAAWIERRFRLREFDPKSPTLQAIHTFLSLHAPGLQVKSNLLRSDQLVFVYPSSYRRTSIAIFGGLVKLWRSDREAAEAILLHEIAHYRNGDTLIVGAGSFFEFILRSWLLLYFLLVFLPETIMLVDQTIRNYQQTQVLYQQVHIYASSSTFLSETKDLVLLLLPLIIFEFFSLLFLTSSVFIVCWIGIWCTELNADQFVVSVNHSADALLRALGQFPPRVSWWRQLLFRTSHPPIKLRRWIACRTRRIKGFLLLILFFPLAYYLKLLVLLLHGFFDELFVHQNFTNFGTLVIRYDLTRVWSDLGADALNYLTSIAPVLGSMAVLLLLWPWLARFWGLIFARPSWKSGSLPAPTLASIRPGGLNTDYFSKASPLSYVLGPVILAGLFLFSYALPNPSATSPASTSRATSSASASSTPGISGNEGKHFKVGDHVRIEGIWITTVNSVRTDATNKIYPPMSGDTFLVVDVTLQNVSSQDQIVNSFIQFTLSGLNGKTYDEKIGATYSFSSGKMLDKTVPSGSTDHGKVVFEVPESVHQFTLLFSSDPQYVAVPGSPHLTTWDVTI